MSMSQDIELGTTCQEMRTVILALEPVVAAVMVPPLKAQRGYNLFRLDVSMHDIDDLDNGLAIFPGVPDSVGRTYESDRTEKPHYQVHLSVVTYFADAVQVIINVRGPSTHETVGLVERLRNTVSKEIARQDGSEWNLEPLGFPPIPSAASKDAEVQQLKVDLPHVQINAPRDSIKFAALSAPAPAWRRWLMQLWKTTTTHPLIVALIGTVVGGLILLAVVAKFHLGAPNNQPPTPTTSTTQSQTVQPPPSGSVGGVGVGVDVESDRPERNSIITRVVRD